MGHLLSQGNEQHYLCKQAAWHLCKRMLPRRNATATQLRHGSKLCFLSITQMPCLDTC